MSATIGLGPYVNERRLRPKSYEVSEYRCVGCDLGIRNGYTHHFGTGFYILGVLIPLNKREIHYCEECKPPLLSKMR